MGQNEEMSRAHCQQPQDASYDHGDDDHDDDQDDYDVHDVHHDLKNFSES